MGGPAEARRSAGPALCGDDVWRAIERASFGVLAHVSGTGEPRCSGVVYGVVDRHLYVAIGRDGWKARQIADGSIVAMTVTVRRGSLLALVLPIPPATITFRARVTVHAPDEHGKPAIPESLGRLLPDERTDAAVLELVPEGRFLTYGIGVPLQAMRNPAASMAQVPVASA